MMTKTYIFSIFSTLFFYLSVLLFIIGFNFTDTPPGPFWYQQNITSIGNRSISDITFVDSLTGFAVTPYAAGDTAFVLKTTNGGNDWGVVLKGATNTIGGFNRIQFLNLNTGFVCGNFLRKTVDGGLNWTLVNTSGIFPENMYILNVDTMWLINSDGLIGGVFRTTNGGVSWQQQPVPNMDHIYMYNRNIGFVTNTQVEPKRIYKTTDSGQSWSLQNTGESFNDMYFVDSMKGWLAFDSVRVTTNGGVSWQAQILPFGNYSGGFLNYTYIFKFADIDRDTIWGVGGRIAYPNTQLRGLIYKSTNGGNNWYFQLPDTTIHIPQYLQTDFVNGNNGWAYGGPTGVHTITGGDTTLLNIEQVSSEVPIVFKLFQNYPNPFNPVTKIKYQIVKDVKEETIIVKLVVYDITGREITTLVNQKQNPGTYQVEFSGNKLASGVYFYSLLVDGNLIDTKKLILLK